MTVTNPTPTPDAPAPDLLRECAKIIGQALLAPAKPHNGKVDPIGALVPAAEAGAAYLIAALRAEAQPVAWRWRNVFSDGRRSNWIVQPVEPLRAGVEKEPLYAHPPATSAGVEWRCPKCGAQADERFDCCEVHAQTATSPGAAGESEEAGRGHG